MTNDKPLDEFRQQHVNLPKLQCGKVWNSDGGHKDPPNRASLCTGQFQNRPCPPRANPRAFDFFGKFWSNSPLCCQFIRSNAPPVRASNRVKSPTLQACEANCGDKFCKIFSHYEFLVQLVFAPHFKHIELYKTTTKEHSSFGIDWYISRRTWNGKFWNRI